jgi:hypothetical protein
MRYKYGQGKDSVVKKKFQTEMETKQRSEIREEEMKERTSQSLSFTEYYYGYIPRKVR